MTRDRRIERNATVYAVRVLSNYSMLCFLKVFTASLKMWKPGSSFLKSAMSYGERSNPASLTFAVLTGGGSWSENDKSEWQN